MRNHAPVMKIPPPHCEAIIRLINLGCSPREIKNKTKICGTTIRYWARKSGARKFPPGRPKGSGKDYSVQIQKMRKMRFGDALTLREIGAKFSISRERVRQLIGNTGHAHYEFQRKQLAKILLELPEFERLKLNVNKPLFNATRSMWEQELGKYHHAYAGGSGAIGQAAEQEVSKTLFELGIENKLMPLNHPFDILLIRKNVRIDVKFCGKPKPATPGASPQWQFDCKSKRSNSDFHICVLGDSGTWFVIPTSNLPMASKLQFCWPTRRPKIHKHLNCKFIPFQTPVESVDAFS